MKASFPKTFGGKLAKNKVILRRSSSTAEQRFCKAKVGGSNPLSGFVLKVLTLKNKFVKLVYIKNYEFVNNIKASFDQNYKKYLVF